MIQHPYDESVLTPEQVRTIRYAESRGFEFEAQAPAEDPEEEGWEVYLTLATKNGNRNAVVCAKGHANSREDWQDEIDHLVPAHGL